MGKGDGTLSSPLLSYPPPSLPTSEAEAAETYPPSLPPYPILSYPFLSSLPPSLPLYLPPYPPSLPVGESEAAERDERRGAPEEEDEVRGQEEHGAHQDVQRAVAVPVSGLVCLVLFWGCWWWGEGGGGE